MKEIIIIDVPDYEDKYQLRKNGHFVTVRNKKTGRVLTYNTKFTLYRDGVGRQFTRQQLLRHCGL